MLLFFDGISATKCDGRIASDSIMRVRRMNARIVADGKQ